MNAIWSEAKVKVSHRLAMHLRVDDGFRLRNDRPMVTFTFDDLPKSAVTTAAARLEAQDARGTFYVSGGAVGIDTHDWEAGTGGDVIARTCATTIGVTHSRLARLRSTTRRWPARSGNNTSTDPSIEVRHTTRSATAVRTISTAEEFRAAGASYQASTAACRSTFCARRRDRPRDGRFGIDRLRPGQSTNGWLIFYGHDVAEQPSPMAARSFCSTLDAASDRKITVLPWRRCVRRA